MLSTDHTNHIYLPYRKTNILIPESTAATSNAAAILAAAILAAAILAAAILAAAILAAATFNNKC